MNAYSSPVPRNVLAAVLLVLPIFAVAKTLPPSTPLPQPPPPQHLQPCGNFLNSYAAQVDAIVDRGSAGNYLASLTVLPSFEPEWGIRIGTANKAFYLRLVTLKNSYWNSSWQPTGHSGDVVLDLSKGHADAAINQVPISEGLAETLHSVLGEEVSHTAPSEILGLDGTNYLFSYEQGSCAVTWSPEPSTRPGKLVGIFMALKKLATEKSAPARAKLERKILSELENYSSE